MHGVCTDYKIHVVIWQVVYINDYACTDYKIHVVVWKDVFYTQTRRYMYIVVWKDVFYAQTIRLYSGIYGMAFFINDYTD